MQKYPMIYIRMGEAGMMTLPFYRDQIMAGIGAGSECFLCSPYAELVRPTPI